MMKMMIACIYKQYLRYSLQAILVLTTSTGGSIWTKLRNKIPLWNTISYRWTPKYVFGIICLHRTMTVHNNSVEKCIFVLVQKSMDARLIKWLLKILIVKWLYKIILNKNKLFNTYFIDYKLCQHSLNFNIFNIIKLSYIRWCDITQTGSCTNTRNLYTVVFLV